MGISETDVTDYKLELKISVCMLVNFEFGILTEFAISILNYEI